MVAPAVVAAGIAAFTALVSAGLSASQAAKAARAKLRGSKKALAEFDEIITPVLQEEQTAYENVQRDPYADAAQRRALESYIRQAEEGGLDFTERAALEDIQGRARTEEQSQRAAIEQQARARGMAGAGSTLGAQLLAQQGAASRAGSQGLSVAAMQQQRHREALANAGQLGGLMRSQQFDEQERLARARDAIKAFNAAQRQQYFQNRMNLAGARGAAQLNKGAAEGAVYAQNAQSIEALGGGLGQGVSTVGNYLQQGSNDSAQRAHELELARIMSGR